MNLKEYLSISEEGLGDELKERAQRMLYNALIILSVFAILELIAAGWVAYDIGDMEGWYIFIAAAVFVTFEVIAIFGVIRLFCMLVYAQGVNVNQLKKFNNKEYGKLFSSIIPKEQNKKITETKEKPMHKTLKPVRIGEENISCPACNTVQPSIRKRCLKCGTFFE